MIAAALAMLILLASVSAAAEVEPLPADGIYAVMTMSDGSVEVDGAPAADELAGVDSYELIVAAEPALEVDRVYGDLRGGDGESVYYSVSFPVPGTTQEFFLTGLKAEYVEEIQDEIIGSWLNGSNFRIERLSFIDAEKTADEDGDDDLCWAASAADILTYTGWAAQAGFDSEDDLFEAFISNFTNDGSSTPRALAWFFNGSAIGNNSGYESSWSYSTIVDYPDSGGYLRDYSYDMLCKLQNIYSAGEVGEMFGHLRSGKAVSLGLNVYLIGEGPLGGHMVTLWGYSADTSVPEGDSSRYLSVFISDSDSDELSGEDRRGAPNVLSNCRLLWDSNGYPYFYYSKNIICYPDDYTWLLPCSADLPYETSDDATRSKASDPDLTISGVYLSDSDELLRFTDLFESGSELTLSLAVSNSSDAAYTGSITVHGAVTDSGSARIADKSATFSLSSELRPNYYVNVTDLVKTDPLPAGDYTLTYTVDPQRRITEAYYYNNTRSVSFKVRDSYLLGDYDGSGSIDIMDVTAIQRSLAAYHMELGEGAEERGDVNGRGLDILDANAVQRSLVGYQVGLPIGEKRLYS